MGKGGSFSLLLTQKSILNKLAKGLEMKGFEMVVK